MKHRCPWPECTAQVPAHLWGCKQHWFQLPKGIRDRIYAAYKPGQSIATASDEYRAALDGADRWIASYQRVERARGSM
jgi:hypothetical protein